MIDSVMIVNHQSFNDLRLSNIAGWSFSLISGTIIAYIISINIGKASKMLELKVKLIDMVEEKFSDVYQTGSKYLVAPSEENLRSYLLSNKHLSQTTCTAKKLGNIKTDVIFQKQREIQFLLTAALPPCQQFPATVKNSFDSICVDLSENIIKQKMNLYNFKQREV